MKARTWLPGGLIAFGQDVMRGLNELTWRRGTSVERGVRRVTVRGRAHHATVAVLSAQERGEALDLTTIPVHRLATLLTRLRRAARGLGVPTELVWLPRTGHGPTEPGLHYETARRQKEWVDRWIRKKGVKPAAN